MCIFLSISFPLPLLTVVLPDAFCNLAALNENFQISFMVEAKSFASVDSFIEEKQMLPGCFLKCISGPDSIV